MTRPTKPNITIPESFATNGRKADFSNEKILNGFDPINPDVLCGDNLNKLIDDTFKGLNYSIDSVDELYKGAVLYDSHETYNLNSLVFHVDSNNKTHMYRSIANNNCGNNLSNTGYWNEIIIDSADFVPKSGGTMTGELIISKNTYQQLQLKNPNQTAGTTPGSESNMGIRFYDSGSTYVGYIQNSYGTDGSRYMLLNCRNGASTNSSTIKWGFDGNGNANLWLPNSTCIDGQWINSQTLLTSTTTGNNTITADLSNYLPNDGQKYEVKMWYNFYDYGDNNGKVCPETDIFLQNNTTNKTYYLDSGNQYSRHNCFEITLPVGTSRWVKTYFEDANTTRYWWAIGYRRIGTNG